ncbi:MAG: hypothetical protein HQL78_14215 [Magnetococcales bacterium]|nr:hypothetical protein [Magnetococcales bacterium]MBF0421303.1 hypothetical protein [Magnetococcales bacterium]
MVIEGAGQVGLLSYFEAIKISETSGLSSADRVSSAGGPAVSVDISRVALDQSKGIQTGVAFPPLLVTEDVMRWNLTRIFMETLFGKKDQNAHKAEMGLVEGVIDEVSYDAQLEAAKREKGNGQP